MKKSILTLLLICYPCHSWAGQQNPGSKEKQVKEPYLAGRVVDFFSKPISGAKVIIEGTKWEAQTDAQGQFEPFTLIPGTYAIRVTHPQYKPLICKDFALTKGGKHASFMLKRGSPNDNPVIRDDRPQGQFVIDEDAEPIEKVEPVYPESALRDKVEGTVSLNVYVNAMGEVVNAWVGQGVREDLNHAALEAIQEFKFKPAKVKGKPVWVDVTIPFNFRLADKSSSFPLKEIEGPLTPEDIKQALGFLGVEMERFTYEIPYKHRVKFWIDQYLDGKPIKSRGMLGGSPQPGKCSILLFKYQKDDSVRYTISLAGGSGRSILSFDKISIKGYSASGVPQLPASNLQSGMKVPVYVYALPSRGVSFNLGDPLAQIIARIKFVIVISAELQLE
jgi:TonB family protein